VLRRVFSCSLLLVRSCLRSSFSQVRRLDPRFNFSLGDTSRPQHIFVFRRKACPPVGFAVVSRACTVPACRPCFQRSFVDFLHGSRSPSLVSVQPTGLPIRFSFREQRTLARSSFRSSFCPSFLAGVLARTDRRALKAWSDFLLAALGRIFCCPFVHRSWALVWLHLETRSDTSVRR
jgi:hypothetical protein